MNTPKMPQTASAPMPKVKRGLKAYFAEIGRESKKVNWPTKEETTRLTGVVLAVCGLVILILVVLNEAFQFIIDFLQKGSFA